MMTPPTISTTTWGSLIRLEQGRDERREGGDDRHDEQRVEPGLDVHSGVGPGEQPFQPLDVLRCQPGLVERAAS